MQTALERAVVAVKKWPLERLWPVVTYSIRDLRGPRPIIRGLKTQQVLGDPPAVLLIHPQLKPWEWRALVGLRRDG